MRPESRSLISVDPFANRAIDHGASSPVASTVVSPVGVDGAATGVGVGDEVVVAAGGVVCGGALVGAAVGTEEQPASSIPVTTIPRR
jgi:hypothetical protein